MYCSGLIFCSKLTQMKRYKLKKWYPSLPKDIKVGDEVELSGEYYCMKLGNTCVPKEQVENHPDFWEEVKEPEELCVPVGTKFISDNIEVYTIYKVENGLVWLNWKGDKIGTHYQIWRVNKNFTDGNWKEVKPLLVTEEVIEKLECIMQEVLKEYGVTCLRNLMISDTIEKFEHEFKKILGI